MRESTALLTLLFAFLTPHPSLGQTERSFQAHPVDDPPSVDGHLDERAWREAPSASGFLQFEPEEGAPATEETNVHVLYGNGNLYVGAVLHDENPSRIRERLTRRDDYNQADWFLVSVDSDFNQRTAYTFGVNAAGVQLDALQEGGSRNYSWDAVWESSVQQTEDGWTVEMRIPYSMLRFPEEKLQTWGIHFIRKIPRLGELSEWPLIPRTSRSNLVANYGHMTDISDIEPRPNLQIRPYSVARLRTMEDNEKPGTMATAHSTDLGGNMKVGLGPNTTLDVAVNPDFGQVESDPAVLNLTAFETFFDERRPFFVEGQQYYEFEISGGDLFYSRRIGSKDPIIGASKLSGRTSGGLSFGILGATTGGEFTPSRGYGVARVSQQFDQYSSLGGILTAFEGSNEKKQDHSRSLTGGTDWDLRFNDNKYSFRGYGAFTHQRDAAENQTRDTEFSGELEFEKQEGKFRVRTNAKATEKNFDPNNVGQLTQDKTNFAEVYATYDYDLIRSDPFGPFRRVTLGGAFAQTYSIDERISRRQFSIFDSNFRTENFQDISISGRLFNFWDSYDLYETRGLWPRNRKYFLKTSLGYSTDERREWRLSSNVDYTFRGSGGGEYGLSLSGNWNASDRIALSGSITGEWEREVLAWSSNESFLSTTKGWKIGDESVPPENLSPEEYSTFEGSSELDQILEDVPAYQEDSYYVPVYGERNTRSLDLTVRSTIAFTPTISLQVYSQLFLARGEYGSFKILQNRDSIANLESYPKTSIFEINSLNSNVVFRWRFRPGSTLFLVWDQSRRSRYNHDGMLRENETNIEDNIRDRVGEVFSTFPNNNFIVKIEYNIPT